MNTTHNTKTKRLVTAVAVAAATVATPTLLFASAGTAQADPCAAVLAAVLTACSLTPSESGEFPEMPEPIEQPLPYQGSLNPRYGQYPPEDPQKWLPY
jgi:hypothetical protein